MFTTTLSCILIPLTGYFFEDNQGKKIVFIFSSKRNFCAPEFSHPANWIVSWPGHTWRVFSTVNTQSAKTGWIHRNTSHFNSPWQFHAATNQFHTRERCAVATCRLGTEQTSFGTYLKSRVFQPHFSVPNPHKTYVSLLFFTFSFPVEKWAPN